MCPSFDSREGGQLESGIYPHGEERSPPSSALAERPRVVESLSDIPVGLYRFPSCGLLTYARTSAVFDKFYAVRRHE